MTTDKIAKFKMFYGCYYWTKEGYEWRYNKLLSMSAQEQYRRNVENGTIDPNFIKKPVED